MNVAPATWFPDAEIATDLRFVDETGRLEARRVGVGSSDIAVLTGDSRYDTPLGMFADKTGRTPIDTGSSEAAEWGQTLEPVIAAKFAERWGVELYDAPYILRSLSTGWHCASPDYMILANGRPELVEIKCRRNPWPDGPPQSIIDQCVWQMHVTGVAKCHIVVLFAGCEMPPPFSIVADPHRASQLAELADRFWSHVLLDEPPPPMPVDTRRMIPGPGQILLTDDQIEALRRREALKAEAKQLIDEAEALADPIRVAMADVETAVDRDGEIVATYRAGKKSRTFLGKVAA